MRLLVIPSDPLKAYEEKGLTSLEAYYNPGKMFDEVYAISPYETYNCNIYGMHVDRVDKKFFKDRIRKIRPDIVRAYGGYWASDLACYNRVKNTPIVVSVHDTNKDLLYKSVRHADMVLCMSKAVYETVEAFGVSRKRIRILPNRVSTDTFCRIEDPAAFSQLANRLPKGKCILHIGRKVEQKNLDTLIRALSCLPPEYYAVFIGAGDICDYRELAHNLGVEERCVWIESVKNTELPLWYSWCDCFCTPSRWEGFGVVFIEAAACACPIVTSDIPPMNEFLCHNENAHLVGDYEDSEALAKGIRQVCECPDYAQKLGTSAREMSLRYSRASIDAMEMAYYHEALQLRSRNLAGLEARLQKHLGRFRSLIK